MANDFLPFAAAGGANVMSQSSYAALAARSTGFVAGVAVSAQLNKAWRQPSVMASVVGQFISDESGLDALDDGNTTVLLNRLKSALRTSNPLFVTGGGTANAITANMLPALTSYSKARLLILTPQTANTRSAVTINIDGLGLRSIVRPGNQPLRRGDLQNRPMILVDNGTAYEIQASGGSSRTLLTGALNLYVSTTGSDSSNDGLDPTAPFLTIQRAWSEILSNYDLNGFQAFVNIADGTYTGGVVATGNPAGGNAGTGTVVFQGNATTPANVLVAVTGGHCFLAQGGAQFTVKDMKLQTAGANTNCLLANPGGLIAFTNVNFGGTVSAHLNALGGFIQATGNYTITGGGETHVFASALGKVSLSTRTVTITGTPNFNTGFAYSQQGRTEAISSVFSGAATGPRYVAIENGVVTTGGAGATFLPGNAAGATGTGGQYA